MLSASFGSSDEPVLNTRCSAESYWDIRDRQTRMLTVRIMVGRPYMARLLPLETRGSSLHNNSDSGSSLVSVSCALLGSFKLRQRMRAWTHRRIRGHKILWIVSIYWNGALLEKAYAACPWNPSEKLEYCSENITHDNPSSTYINPTHQCSIEIKVIDSSGAHFFSWCLMLNTFEDFSWNIAVSLHDFGETFVDTAPEYLHASFSGSQVLCLVFHMESFSNLRTDPESTM